jgi:hypothetical protein
MDACLAVIPLVLPSRYLPRDERLAVQPTIQALPVHDADFRLGHVQPTAMLGRVVELDLVQQPTRHLRPKCLIQAGAVVQAGIQLLEALAALLGGSSVASAEANGDVFFKGPILLDRGFV